MFVYDWSGTVGWEGGGIMRLRRKRVVSLPAGQGIARANVIACAAPGAHRVATGVEGQAQASLAAGRPDIGRRRRGGAVAHGPYDCLRKCACFVHKGTVEACWGADWDLSFDLGVKSMYRATRACVPGPPMRAEPAPGVTI